MPNPKLKLRARRKLVVIAIQTSKIASDFDELSVLRGFGVFCRHALHSIFYFFAALSSAEITLVKNHKLA